MVISQGFRCDAASSLIFLEYRVLFALRGPLYDERVLWRDEKGAIEICAEERPSDLTRNTEYQRTFTLDGIRPKTWQPCDISSSAIEGM